MPDLTPEDSELNHNVTMTSRLGLNLYEFARDHLGALKKECTILHTRKAKLRFGFPL